MKGACADQLFSSFQTLLDRKDSRVVIDCERVYDVFNSSIDCTKGGTLTFSCKVSKKNIQPDYSRLVSPSLKTSAILFRHWSVFRTVLAKLVFLICFSWPVCRLSIFADQLMKTNNWLRIETSAWACFQFSSHIYFCGQPWRESFVWKSMSLCSQFGSGFDRP